MNVDLPLERRDIIASRLSDGQPVVATTLATEFGVSEDAIRRDLRALAAAGRCRRVYGGALPMAASTLTVTARSRQSPEEKAALARTAAATVKAGELVFLDSGSTNLALVEFLPEDADLTVVTNAVEIASAVVRRQDLKLIVIGGIADPAVGGCVDAAAVQALGLMRLDLAFIGACSVSPERGVGAFHFADATFKRAVVAAARRVVALATSEKLSQQAPYHVVEAGRLDLLVVPAEVEAERLTGFAAVGCRVLAAHPH